jgi:hypothetical protein
VAVDIMAVQDMVAIVSEAVRVVDG